MCQRAAGPSSCVYSLQCFCVCVCVMDRYHAPSSRRTVRALRPGLCREQVMVYLLTLAQEKPLFVNSMTAVMKVTDAAAINQAERSWFKKTVEVPVMGFGSG